MIRSAPAAEALRDAAAQHEADQIQERRHAGPGVRLDPGGLVGGGEATPDDRGQLPVAPVDVTRGYT
jgi:hypothetical protein